MVHGVWAIRDLAAVWKKRINDRIAGEASFRCANSVVFAGFLLIGSSALAQTDLEGLDCLSSPFDAPETAQQQEIAALVGWLQARLAAHGPLAEVLREEPPDFCFGERPLGAQGYYELDTNRIVLRRRLPVGLMRAIAIHELRHVHQTRLGACPNPDMSMHATAQVVMAMEADASAVTLAIAWELKDVGEPEVWNALFAWHTHRSLARAFEEEMQQRGDLGLAASAAFAEWYENASLRESYYLSACSDYLDRQDAANLLPSYGAFDPELLETLCILPNGVPYRCEALE